MKPPARMQVTRTFQKCKNTGAISLAGDLPSTKNMCVTGISMSGTLTSCSNSGIIKVNGQTGNGNYSLHAAGVTYQGAISNCSNSGKVSGKKGSRYVGGVLGSYDNGAASQINKYFVYNNYSTSAPLYGTSMISWKAYVARGKKVKSITKREIISTLK